MNIKSYVLKFLVAQGLLLISCISFASGPAWTFLPLTTTSLVLNINDVYCASYLVTNKSTVTHNLEKLPQNGTAAINDPDLTAGICNHEPYPTCDLVFSLDPQESCVLYITMRMLPAVGPIIGGPVVCEQGNVLQCYTPNPNDLLHILIAP